MQNNLVNTLLCFCKNSVLAHLTFMEFSELGICVYFNFTLDPSTILFCAYTNIHTGSHACVQEWAHTHTLAPMHTHAHN